MIVLALNGYSASLRRTRTQDLVERILEERGVEARVYAYRSTLLGSGARRARKRIEQAAGQPVLIVGKSLGARNAVKFVLNRLGRSGAGDIVLVTIDPCWPTWTNWAPNLNRSTLRLTRPVRRAINLQFVASDQRQQAGAQLVGPAGTPLENRVVTGCDHFTIIDHPAARGAILDGLLSL